MPRKSRIDAPGALQHIIIRGIERRRIFSDDTDRDNFIERLGNLVEETQTFCLAWALLPNHVHLLLKTGKADISTVMRRLLTGYAVSYNRRHQRHGHLFQNRYKSILCHEDTYLLELVRYIHLNPLRAGIVGDLRGLDRYPYSGHSALLGKIERQFQRVEEVLRLFGKDLPSARKGYRAYLAKGVDQGRRPELVGGGLIRSTRGWFPAASVPEGGKRPKSDESILGDGDFVDAILKQAREQYEQSFRLRAQGYDLEKLAHRVSELTGVSPKLIFAPGKQPQVVKARSLLCYWAVSRLGMSATELSRRLPVSQPSVSISVRRGETIATAGNFSIRDD